MSRQSRTRVTLAAAAAAALLAFSPRPAVAQDAAVDAAPADLAAADAEPPVPCERVIGRLCTATGNECGTEAQCLLVTQDEGVCTCACTPDDPTTPTVNEDDCPDQTKNICGEVTYSGYWVENYCFRKCQPRLNSSDCEAPVACDPSSTAYSGKLDQAVCLFVGCQTDDDCPLTTSQACDPTQPPPGACAAGQTCLALSSTVSTLGICTTPGKCDTASGLCDKHKTTKPTAAIGDPCKSDLECGEYMTCFQERDPTTFGQQDHGASCFSDDECCGSCDPMSYTCAGTCAVRVRNGYCTLLGCTLATATDFTEHGCPTGSTCNRLFYGGVCAKTCSLSNAADCRGHNFDVLGDYECRAWNNIELGGITVTDEPICDFGYIARCDIWGTTSYSCESLGDQSDPANINPTKMGCRKLDGTKTVDPADPQGFCLDDTAAGPAAVASDGGPPDSTPGDGPAADGPAGDGPVAGDGPAEPDAGVADSGAADDSVVFTDSSVPRKDAGKADGGTTPKKDDGGCSCALRDAGAGPLWLLLLALVALRPRKRR